MIVGRCRYGALTVPAQIGSDHGEMVGQRRCNQMPHCARLRMPVQEQERRPRASDPDTDDCLASLDELLGESLKHRRSFPARTDRRYSLHVRKRYPTTRIDGWTATVESYVC